MLRFCPRNLDFGVVRFSWKVKESNHDIIATRTNVSWALKLEAAPVHSEVVLARNSPDSSRFGGS